MVECYTIWYDLGNAVEILMIIMKYFSALMCEISADYKRTSTRCKSVNLDGCMLFNPDYLIILNATMTAILTVELLT